jgi:hypothetical protein
MPESQNMPFTMSVSAQKQSKKSSKKFQIPQNNHTVCEPKGSNNPVFQSAPKCIIRRKSCVHPVADLLSKNLSKCPQDFREKRAGTSALKTRKSSSEVHSPQFSLKNYTTWINHVINTASPCMCIKRQKPPQKLRQQVRSSRSSR